MNRWRDRQRQRQRRIQMPLCLYIDALGLEYYAMTYYEETVMAIVATVDSTTVSVSHIRSFYRTPTFII